MFQHRGTAIGPCIQCACFCIPLIIHFISTIWFIGVGRLNQPINQKYRANLSIGWKYRRFPDRAWFIWIMYCFIFRGMSHQHTKVSELFLVLEKYFINWIEFISLLLYYSFLGFISMPLLLLFLFCFFFYFFYFHFMALIWIPFRSIHFWKSRELKKKNIQQWRFYVAFFYATYGNWEKKMSSVCSAQTNNKYWWHTNQL